MSWPDVDPVWQFCWLRPANSSGGNGSGLEIRNVYYKGHLVLKRGHIPILNVEYDPGGCGCYRDWSNQEHDFQADNEILPGYAEPTTLRSLTVCDTGGSGGDIGSILLGRRRREALGPTDPHDPARGGLVPLHDEVALLPGWPHRAGLRLLRDRRFVHLLRAPAPCLLALRLRHRRPGEQHRHGGPEPGAGRRRPGPRPPDRQPARPRRCAGRTARGSPGPWSTP